MRLISAIAFLHAMLTAAGPADEIMAGRNPNIAVLTEDTFESFVSSKASASAVMFTSPWCFVCGALLPLWAETARLVQSSSSDPTTSSLPGNGKVNFAVIDATKYEKIAESNSIQGFPTIKIFIDEEVFSYVHDSPFTPVSASLFVNWVNHHTKRRNVVSTEAQLTEFLKDNHLVVIGFFDNSDASKNAREALSHSSMHFEDVFFIEVVENLPQIVSSFAKLTEKPPVTRFPAIAMVYDHDDRYAVMSGSLFTQETIDSFIRGRRLLTVNVFQPGTVEYILDAGLPMLFLISPTGSDDGTAKEALKKVAEKYLGRIVAITLGTAQPWEQKLGEVLDLHDISKPVVRILEAPPSNHHDHNPISQSQIIIRHGLKFKPSAGDIDVTENGLSQFIDLVLSGTEKPYVRSEPEPEDPRESFTPGSVLVNAVATNFDKLVVQDIKRDILVVYHAPWCGFCRKLMPTLRELGSKLAHAGKGLKVVKIDATRNEVPQVSISGYPTIMLYTATDAVKPIHERKAVQYTGDRSIDDLISFLHSNAVNPFSDQAPPGTTSDQELHYAFEEL